MKMNQRLKITIDNMDYTEMLSKASFAPIGSDLFLGESGDYFMKRMAKMRNEVGDEYHTKACKQIGWGE